MIKVKKTEEDQVEARHTIKDLCKNNFIVLIWFDENKGIIFFDFNDKLQVFSNNSDIRSKYMSKFDFYSESDNIICYQILEPEVVISFSKLLLLKHKEKRTES